MVVSDGKSKTTGTGVLAGKGSNKVAELQWNGRGIPYF